MAQHVSGSGHKPGRGKSITYDIMKDEFPDVYKKVTEGEMPNSEAEKIVINYVRRKHGFRVWDDK